MADRFDKLFATAPKPVVDYFDRRPQVPSFDWRDIAPREHALAFTVAKTAGFDVLDDLHQAVRKAVVDQVPFEAFKKQITPLLQQKGWWGRQVATDPADQRDKMVQLGSPRRLKIIYDANVASAHAAGEWTRIQETKDFLPYLRYLTSISERKRPEHLSWVGTTLPADHPWWRTHFPPNGWNCKCRVDQLAAHEAKGTPPEKRRAPPGKMVQWKNKRTGETESVPEGIDPGWQHNAGEMRDRTITRQLTSAMDAMPAKARGDAIEKLRRHPVMDYVVNNKAGFDHTRRLDPAQVATGRFMAAVASVPEEIAKALRTERRTLALSVADAAKQIAKERGLAVADYAIVEQMLAAPDIVFQQGDNRLAVIATVDGQRWQAIIKRTGADELLLNSFHRRDRGLPKGEELAVGGP